MTADCCLSCDVTGKKNGVAKGHLLDSSSSIKGSDGQLQKKKKKKTVESDTDDVIIVSEEELNQCNSLSLDDDQSQPSSSSSSWTGMDDNRNGIIENDSTTAMTTTATTTSGFRTTSHHKTTQTGSDSEKAVPEVGRRAEEEMSSKLRKALEDNIRLRSVLHDVTLANERWLRYNRERQGYVEKLLKTIKELQEREVEGAAWLAQAQDVQATCEALKVENLSLRNDVTECKQQISGLQDVLRTQQREHGEKVALLQMQIRIHCEDFSAEKEEKEAARLEAQKMHEEIAFWKEKMNQVEHQLKTQQQQQQQQQLPVPRKNGGFCASDSPLHPHHSQKTFGLQNYSSSSSSAQVLPSRYSNEPIAKFTSGCSSSGGALNPLKLGPAHYHHQQQQHSHAAFVSAPLNQEEEEEEKEEQEKWFLICPKCQKKFPPSLEIQFSSHIEECNQTFYG